MMDGYIEVFDGTHRIRASVPRTTHHLCLAIHVQACTCEGEPIDPDNWCLVEDEETRSECMEELLLHLLS